MKKKTIWLLWLGGMLVLGGYFGYRLFGAEDKSVFLIGQATDGHHQIEMACGACHTSPFGGKDLLQNACVKCHGEALKLANDSHPKSKFTDPRNADRLQFLDARYCVTCHREHRREQTHPMGLTLPVDYCFRCHSDIAKDRPSHAGMNFSSCASAGCHNFHDNSALYEDYLVKFAYEPALKSVMLRPALASFAEKFPGKKNAIALTGGSAEAPTVALHKTVVDDWAASAHAEAGVNCKSCHMPEASNAWDDHPDIDVCKSCHAAETASFFNGKHGMRLDPRLSMQLTPMTPAQGRLPFRRDALHRELTCNSCHGAHRYDTRAAAVDSCLGCHDDKHSRNFTASNHARLWRAEMAGRAPVGSGVSCATCHLPRVERELPHGKRVLVDHDQNDNLRPREKMIRSVCQHCHGLAFSIDALADNDLVERNFIGLPARHIKSIDMAVQRAAKTKH